MSGSVLSLWLGPLRSSHFLQRHQDLLPFGPVYGFMAGMTDRDKVLFGVVSRMASELLMTHFEASHCSAELAAPAIPLQDGITKLMYCSVSRELEVAYRSSLSSCPSVHAAASPTSSMNRVCCSELRNLK
jgi:hypothetical protein